MKLEYKINTPKYANLKDILKSHFHISERLLVRLKKHHKIFVNNIPISTINISPNIGDLISVDISFNEESENIVPTKINLDILFEDDSMLIVNKQPGLPVHPSAMHFEDSLSNGIQHYYNKQNIHTKIRPVNRLDKDTSGIVIFAKNEYVQNIFTYQMTNHIFEKSYLAILNGNLNNSAGTIDAPIARKSGSIIEREVNKHGQKSVTYYKLIKNYDDFCLVEFKLETGRTHQIRVHSQYIGHPILGDSLYGTGSELINRQALHAYKISFLHPADNRKMEFEIDLPKDMKNLIL